MIIACFQIAGISACLYERLKSLQRYCRPRGPRWRRCKMVRLSGLEAMELLLSCMASVTCVVVKISVLWSSG